jgi:predicted ATP-grasp superfamily ATP-dependent carboligase
MMKKKKIVMTSPWPTIAEEAKQEDFYLIVLWDKNHKSSAAYNKVSTHADELYMIDFSDDHKVESILKWIHSFNDVEYIYHLGKDEHVELIYRVAEELKRNVNDLETIFLINNKKKMRQHLEANGISPIRYTVANLFNITEKAEAFTYPFIVKPVNLSGSQGVALCHEVQDLERWKASVKALDYCGEFLIEEYLRGIEVSVETITFQNEHYMIGITDKLKTPPPQFIEMGHIFPSRLDKHTKEAVEKLIKEVLTSLRYSFGPCHSEVIITEAGPRLVELQPRLAGDRIPRLIEHSTGMRMENIIFKMLKGIRPHISMPKKISQIHYFNWTPGEVLEIKGINEARTLCNVKEIFINNPERISSVTDSYTRPGYVIVEGESYEELHQTINEVNERMTITYRTETDFPSVL